MNCAILNTKGENKMDWLQVLAIAGSTVGSMWFMHRESAREMREMREIRSEVSKEMRDFHGRLCSLEERYIQMMQRMLEKK